MEEWRDIEGYEGLYQVSNEGRVKSLERMVDGTGKWFPRLIKTKILKQNLSAQGYKQVNLHNEEGVQKTQKVHRLVAKAFIPNPQNKPHIDHINTIRTDNRSCNLRWVTQKENSENPITHQRILTHVRSEELRNASSRANKGKVVSSETRKKQSESHKGIGCVSVNKFTLDGRVITTYLSIDKAAEELGLFAGDIGRCCKGIRKTCGGFKWGYA